MKFALGQANERWPLLIDVLRDPGTAAFLDAASCGLLIRQARKANVLGRTLAAIEATIPIAEWPARPRQILAAEKYIADQRYLSLRWEVEGLARQLAIGGIRLILLKGAAYVLDKHAFGRYRHFGDIDILVARKHLAVAEQTLNSGGWLSTNLDPYDQQYYRRWMHELPPMQHIHRGTNLDLHHAILPQTARYSPNSNLLLNAAVPARDLEIVDVLAPVDMFLHAATHLFCEGESDNALRNLLDLHDLLIAFVDDGRITVADLIDRSVELDLVQILVLAARHLQRIFPVVISLDVCDELRKRGLVPSSIGNSDWMFDAAFLGFHPSYQPAFTKLAHVLLYFRGHLLRMPLGMLVVHIARKAWSSRGKVSSAA